MLAGVKNYLTITGAYWGFTLTDGAIRMLVVLYFHQLGYSPLAIASLFLFYEFFGVVTNLVGGWLGQRFGLNTTLYSGMILQIGALLMLAVDTAYLSVPYVMAAQAISGIAKDLNKMSAKSSVKLMVPSGAEGTLFRWVAVLTGSKNTLKGGGFFLGGLLLGTVGFQSALLVLAAGLSLTLLVTLFMLPRAIGKPRAKSKFSQLFSKSREINYLSAARFLLFGARDIWFVVALPVFFVAEIGWSSTAVGTFMASWVIGYGIVQATSPALLRQAHHDLGPNGRDSRFWLLVMSGITLLIYILLGTELPASWVIVLGLGLFGIVFAINSSIHSFLILSYSDNSSVSMDVGFYYMANAAGRLAGTVLSGGLYQLFGLSACLLASVVFLLLAWGVSLNLPGRDK